MSKVDGGGPIDPPPLKASCNYFFLKASRVKDIKIKVGRRSKQSSLFFMLLYGRATLLQ